MLTRILFLCFAILLLVFSGVHAAGEFTLINTGLPPVSLSDVAWGDYDNDGDLDILIAGLTGSYPNEVTLTQLWRNTGGTFTNINAALPNVYIASLEWGDYDNDGDLDIVINGRTGLDFSSTFITQIWQNTNGTFTNINAGLPGLSHSSVAWGDYDNDGDLDLLLAGEGDGAVVVTDIWRNTNGTFASINAGLTHFGEGSAAWGDYDNDGDLDILMAGMSGAYPNYVPITQIWQNTNGTFTNINAGLPGLYHSSVAWGDYDNDGDLDFLISGRQAAQIWRNDSGAFTNINAGLPNFYYSSAAWGDADNDGDLDLLISGYVENSRFTQLWINNGGDGFSPLADTTFAGSGLGSVAWGDYDNDGDLDILSTGIIATSPSVRHVELWRNNSAVANTPPTAPTNLTAITNQGEVSLSWAASTDGQTTPNGLTYNLRIGRLPGAFDLMPPMADTVTGFRRVAALGNAQHGTTARIDTSQLACGTYYWSVQAVDTVFAGSPFAIESTFDPCFFPTPIFTASPDSSTPTFTPSPDSSTPTPTALPFGSVELLDNGGFEIAGESVAKPEHWTFKKLFRDKRKCDTATALISHQGSCAFLFRGGTAENAKLIQLADLAGYIFEEGDALSYTIQYRTKGTSAPRLKLKLAIVVGGTTIKRIGTSKTASGLYQLVTAEPYTFGADASQVTSIKAVIQHKTLLGKVFIDDASVVFDPADDNPNE